MRHVLAAVVIAMLCSCEASENPIDSHNVDAPPPGKFAAQVTYPVGPAPFPVAISDLDGDDKPDLVLVSNGGGNSNRVAILRNNGGATFAAATLEPPAGCCSLAIGDLNGDMKPDVIDMDAVHLNTGNGTLAPPVFQSIGASIGASVGDLNGDGKLDLAGWGGPANSLVVQFGVGNGTFGPPVSYAAVSGAPSVGTAVAIGDLNGDGKPDVARVNFGDGVSIFDNSVSVYLNNGDGTFAAQVPYTTGRGPTSVAFADLNNDGSLDMVVSSTNDNFVSVLLNTGNGTFAAQRTFPVTSGSGAALSYYLAVGDLNGDGKPDLAVTSTQTNTVNVLMNDGAGSFAPAVSYPTGTEPGQGPSAEGVAIGDLNGDGRPDLAVANRIDGTVSVFLWVP